MFIEIKYEVCSLSLHTYGLYKKTHEFSFSIFSDLESNEKFLYTHGTVMSKSLRIAALTSSLNISDINHLSFSKISTQFRPVEFKVAFFTFILGKMIQFWLY